MTLFEIGYNQAYQMVCDEIQPLDAESLPIQDSVGKISAQNVTSRVNAPSSPTSLMDGYAFSSRDLPPDGSAAKLILSGSAAAGQGDEPQMKSGSAVRVLTGARIPKGVDTVIAEEDVQVDELHVLIKQPVVKGGHILIKGKDIETGDLIINKNERLTPGKIGLLTTGGCSELSVFKKPHVAVIATGDEITLPGRSLNPGALYASNMLTVSSWCRHYNMETHLSTCRDDQTVLEKRLLESVEQFDAVITSGGAWTGDRDLTARCLSNLGWRQCFHRIRLGPGKAAGFGFLKDKPVFILPGGPPSNLTAFLTLALPGLKKLGGWMDLNLPVVPARVSQFIKSHPDWTHSVFGTFEMSNTQTLFYPISKKTSRLKSMATAQGLLLIKEGKSGVEPDEHAWVFDLRI